MEKSVFFNENVRIPYVNITIPRKGKSEKKLSIIHDFFRVVRLTYTRGILLKAVQK